MSGKVSFEGIGEMMATFYAGSGVEAGQVVKVDGDSTVAPCAAGERFHGVVMSVKDGCAVVQVAGFAQLPCADSAVTAGTVSLTADGNGGVKDASAGGTAVELLAVSAGDGTVTVKL